MFIQSKVMSAIKEEENRYFLKFYFEKGKNVTQGAKKSLWTWSVHLALVDQSLEKSMKVWKKIEPRCRQEIKHQPQNSFKSFGLILKNLFNRSNFHLRITPKTELEPFLKWLSIAET